MDRRLFLTGMLGLAGAAAVVSAVRPISAVAGIPDAGSGILDELEAQDRQAWEDDGTEADLQTVSHRYWRRRRRRRRAWRRYCRTYWRYGRLRRRCYRRRVWIWFRL
ncbi:MAG: protamine-2 (modular protein) [Mesorhizobium sp.]|uniref:protamine-2 (modular protein) n=1 Tax=unclassified Mesorhizobium TaxID=325217 RepID=UPI000F756731|nr:MULTISPECIES: protamine-2 (modular protein) [unclassified Mesorhizobium]RVD72470.1 protamine-2 (modular protein) [Mesorhizobium sp. M4A.F.Ca.ET.029.04.2.1]AZO50944.1 protamine-2 (modular protein) [Mesorhizobium sp. M4B.F.Ca.ET.058.02.1.1]RUX45605.1 protamine-2 (modular protein) [Mesorhizobium sp. M4A.F.Ca.ET.050.02.1.1]RVD33370.1 protamine-2 (modular protein) [Mesorhizobium sp. M4A.F.Ca.ET.020.02.1.1]RWC20504.1 MAG: protamine-2 (modular protein) [Mesorhizobium sp.]